MTVEELKEIASDLVTKYKEYLAECLGTTIGDLKHLTEKLSNEDQELLLYCQNRAESEMWRWANENWGWNVGRETWKKLSDLFEEMRKELGY